MAKLAFKIAFLINLAVAFGLLAWGEYLSLLNFELAFIGAALIIFSSYYSYKKKIEASAAIERLKSAEHQHAEEPKDENDEGDEELDKKISKYEALAVSASSYFSPFRLLSYCFLIATFFALSRNDIFAPIPFFVGLGLMPLSSLLALLGFVQKIEHDIEK